MEEVELVASSSRLGINSSQNKSPSQRRLYPERRLSTPKRQKSASRYSQDSDLVKFGLKPVSQADRIDEQFGRELELQMAN